MDIINSTIKVGGNSIKLWLGNKLDKIAKKLINAGTETSISNPSMDCINPFTVIFKFTVTDSLSSNKYQLILQGDFKDFYKKKTSDEEFNITEEEMFMSILSNKNKWFLKN